MITSNLGSGNFFGDVSIATIIFLSNGAMMPCRKVIIENIVILIKPTPTKLVPRNPMMMSVSP